MSEKAALQVGDDAPDFEALDEKGKKVRLKDFRGKKVLLFFYPKDNTPGCTRQACGFRDHYPAIQEKNAVVFGVSPDGQKSHQKFQEKYELPFQLLVDEDKKLAEAYGVWGEKSLYGRKYMGIVRSHFLIDEKGKLQQVEVKVSPKNSIERALKAL